VVPITTYNTVRGFGVSDQELFTNKIIMFMAMLLLLILPTTTETGTSRQHSDYVAPPPLHGQTVGPLSTASVLHKCVVSLCNECELSGTHE
jgi:hypothetical protein